MPELKKPVPSIERIIRIIKVVAQFFISEVLIFCVLKSDHFEFLNTLPNEDTEDLCLLFRSKNILRKPRVL